MDSAPTLLWLLWGEGGGESRRGSDGIVRVFFFWGGGGLRPSGPPARGWAGGGGVPRFSSAEGVPLKPRNPFTLLGVFFSRNVVYNFRVFFGCLPENCAYF